MTRRETTSTVKMAFEEAKLRIAIADIQPLKLVSSAIKKSPKYAQIVASIREVGIVEPPVVARDHSEPGKYLLLDGHLRIDVLKDMGQTDVTCLVSTDDEAFTYNKRVNRLAMIQEHRMILQGDRARCSRRAHCKGAQRRCSKHRAKAAASRGNLPGGRRDPQG